VTGGRGGGIRGGGAITFRRLDTSKKRLSVHWDHPIPVGEQILDYQSALQELRKRDPRPLIVLRECDACKGRDDALLSRTLSNEKTLLLTQWFHCVKLDRRVTEKSHPYHSLFAGDRPPHLFITSWDGKFRQDLDGKQSQKRLWGVMSRVLGMEYRKSADVAVKNWLRLLNRFDFLDSRIQELRGQIARMEGKGKKRRAKALEKKLAFIQKDKQAALSSEKKLMDLVLRRAPKRQLVTDFDEESAAEVKAGGGGGGLLDRIRKGKDPAKNPPPGANR